MSELDSAQPIKIIFDGSNYEVWSQEMSSFLKGRKLWGYVDGGISKPVREKDEDKSEYDKRLDKWERKNHQILMWIRNTCASFVKEEFNHFETAEEVWVFLFKRYKIAIQYRLLEKLSSLKQQQGQSLEEVWSKMRDIWNQLDLFEPVLSCSKDARKLAEHRKKERVMQFLMAIHKDYELARDSLLRRGNLPKLHSVVTELSTEQTRLGTLNNQRTTSVVLSRVSSLSSSTAVNQSDGNSSSSPCSATTGRALTSRQETHQSHPKHPLKMMNLQIVYKCKGCKMEGMGPRYRCDECDFDLHEECMSAIPKITFQGHECGFFEKLPPVCKCESANCTIRRWCDACGKVIAGFGYYCAENEMSFHPKCAMLKSEIPCGDVKFRLQEKGPSKCRLCKEKKLKDTKKKTGWSYVSERGYDFHVHCFMNLTKNLECSSKKSIPTEQHLSLALKGTELTRRTKSKGKDSNFWWKILKTFFSAVFSILLGDPTTLIATSLAHIVTEVFLHVG